MRKKSLKLSTWIDRQAVSLRAQLQWMTVLIDEMDEGIIDEKIQAPSISEHFSTVGDEANEDVEEEPPEEEHDEEIAQREEV